MTTIPIPLPIPRPRRWPPIPPPPPHVRQIVLPRIVTDGLRRNAAAFASLAQIAWIRLQERVQIVDEDGTVLASAGRQPL